MEKTKILLIESNSTLAYEITSMLNFFGYSVTVANSGEKAVELFYNDSEIGLVILDIILGKGMSGAQTADKMIIKRRVPVIFWTDEADKKVIDEVRKTVRSARIIKKCGNLVLLSFIRITAAYIESRNRKLDVKDAAPATAPLVHSLL